MNFIKGQQLEIEGTNYLVVDSRELSKVSGKPVIVTIVNKRGRTLKSVTYFPAQNTFASPVSSGEKVTKEEILELEQAYQTSEATKTEETVENLELELIEAQNQLAAKWEEINALETKVNQLKDKVAQAKQSQVEQSVSKADRLPTLPTIKEVLDTVYIQGSKQGEQIKITFNGQQSVYETKNDKWYLVNNPLGMPLLTANIRRLMSNGATVEVLKVNPNRTYAS